MVSPAKPDVAVDPCDPGALVQPEQLPRRQQSWWLWVMCLVGVDYFSSLAYQPSITHEVAGVLGPIATVVVVLLTFAGLLPIYWYVAGQSPHGQGSSRMLERLIRGWRGKTLLLLLLGFATTDFVMTKTLSLADAAEHTINNGHPQWEATLQFLEDETKALAEPVFGAGVARYCTKQMMVTIVLGVLGFIFWFIIRKGFNRQVVRLAVVVVGVYLLLTAVIIGSGLWYLARHPELLTHWFHEIGPGNSRPEGAYAWWEIIGISLLVFPSLSLGLSGFEMSMVVMPQIKGDPGDDPNRPEGRVRNTRRLLLTAALIMSVFLLGSVLVTSLLIPPEGFKIGGVPSHRALAYLAHGGKIIGGGTASALNPLFGGLFASLYDASTVVILCLAGTSIITSLQTFLPRLLLRLGMEQKWSQTWGVLFLLFALINLAVTVLFKASVSEQRGAYATGVLAGISAAGCLTVLDQWKKRRGPWFRRLHWGYTLVAAVFVVSTVNVIVNHPAGLGISLCFIVVLFAWSVLSRAVRSHELRTVGFHFVDDESRFLWCSMKMLEFPALVPHRPGMHDCARKEQQIRQEHQLAPEMEIVFIEVELEDPSNFYQDLLLEVAREDKRWIIRVRRCVSIAHAIAAVALELSKTGRPPALHFGWSEISPLEASWSYFAFGEGNVPWKVRELIINEEPNPERRPRVIIG